MHDKQKVLTSLKKARSHIEKIIKMVEDEEYCIDVIQQLNAINGYVDSAKNTQLKHHLSSCFTKGVLVKNNKQKQKLIDEVIQAVKLGK